MTIGKKIAVIAVAVLAILGIAYLIGGNPGITFKDDSKNVTTQAKTNCAVDEDRIAVLQNQVSEMRRMMQAQTATIAELKKAMTSSAPTLIEKALQTGNGESVSTDIIYRRGTCANMHEAAGASQRINNEPHNITRPNVPAPYTILDANDKIREQNELEKDISVLQNGIQQVEDDLSNCRQAEREAWSKSTLGSAVLKQAQKDARQDENTLAGLKAQLQQKIAELQNISASP